MEARYRQSDAKMLMPKRKMRAEHPFGHIKHNLQTTSFLMRGLSGARTEVALAPTAFNLTRMIKTIGIAELVRRLARCHSSSARSAI
jgi:hypothetical protein